MCHGCRRSPQVSYASHGCRWVTCVHHLTHICQFCRPTVDRWLDIKAVSKHLPISDSPIINKNRQPDSFSLSHRYSSNREEEVEVKLNRFSSSGGNTRGDSRSNKWKQAPDAWLSDIDFDDSAEMVFKRMNKFDRGQKTDTEVI